MNSQKVKTFSSLVLFVLVSLLLLAGCDLNIDNDETQSQVIFELSSETSIQTINGRSVQKSVNQLDEVTALIVTIEDADQNIIHNRTKIDLINMNGNFITLPIELKAGAYKLTEYFVVDASGNTLFAAPKTNSESAHVVGKPLPIEMILEKDKVTRIKPEILSTKDLKPEEFGYSSFSFELVEKFEFLMSVSIYNTNSFNFELASAHVKITNVNKTLYDKDINAKTTKIIVADYNEMYNVTVTKDKHEPYSKDFTAAELKVYTNKVFKVTLIPIRPIINIRTGSSNIIPGSTFDFGTANESSHGLTHTFTIENKGGKVLKLTGSPKIKIIGDTADFVVDQSGLPDEIASGQKADFQIRFYPKTYSNKSATISITNNDPDYPDFTFKIIGKARKRLTGVATYTSGIRVWRSPDLHDLTAKITLVGPGGRGGSGANWGVWGAAGGGGGGGAGKCSVYTCSLKANSGYNIKVGQYYQYTSISGIYATFSVNYGRNGSSGRYQYGGSGGSGYPSGRNGWNGTWMISGGKGGAGGNNGSGYGKGGDGGRGGCFVCGCVSGQRGQYGQAGYCRIAWTGYQD